MNGRPVYFYNQDAIAGQMPMPGTSSGVPCLHGSALFERLRGTLRAASDAAHGYFADSYLKALDRLMMKLVDYGATPQGDASIQDRASLSIGPAERRRRALAGKHVGLDILPGESTADFADRH